MNRKDKRFALLLKLPLYLWTVLFVLAAMGYVIALSLQGRGELIGVSGQWTLDNYARLREPQYFQVLVNSLRLAALTTLFCALIGYLKEEAPMDEQSFPMVMEMLNYAEGAKEDGDKDVIDILMEETAARTHLREEYFSDYRRYQLMQVNKERVLLACRVIINDLLGKLYRYDYNVGYDCLLDDGNSVSRKLKKSNAEMEVEEDAPCDR